MGPADPLALELGASIGTPLLVNWDATALREGGEANWRLSGELDAERVAELRLLSAAFEDGSVLAVASLRPRDTAGHDADDLAAILVRPEADPTRVSEVRLSVEYGGGGEPRRAGLELYTDPDSPPVRVAADRGGEAPPSPAREAIAMEFRLDGTRGAGSYEVRRP